ncbi:MAG: restriction endonuclease subunit S [Candidatus Electrothrix sp. LOE2]|nr:restriction endonuclease subunit S [Candidatus Electrothrix sp. LOE2]
MKVKEENVPVLRFPGFDGEWADNKISRLFKIKAGGDIEQSHVSDIKTDRFKYPIYANAKKLKGFYGFSDLYKFSPSVITIAGRGVNIGIAHVRTHKFYPIVRLLILIPKGKASVFFFEYAFNRMNIFIESTGVPQLTAPQLSTYHVAFPTLPEQQKIASFLTAVDSKIEQLGKKKALLEQYKKGMMQKLFSQELRFKDEQGNEFPEWETKYFGELYEFKATNSFSRNQLNYETGQVRNIHYGDIHTRFKPQFELFREDVPFINPDVNLDNISDDKFCKEGDLVIADASEDYEDIGKTIEIVSLDGAKVLAGLHTLLARSSTNCIYIGYSSYMMVSSSVRKQIKLIAQGAKVLGISGKRMEKIKVPIPHKEEQRKIATFLSSIDKKINLITTELEKAQTFKKGLLQQMFV